MNGNNPYNQVDDRLDPELEQLFFAIIIKEGDHKFLQFKDGTRMKVNNKDIAEIINQLSLFLMLEI